MQKFIRLNKYLSYKSSLEAYSWIGNISLDNNLSLNLYIVLIICYIIIFGLDDKVSERLANNLV